ncbi:hypothetical protein DWB61_11640 [Ancylomarina euxinus]|uniref:Uncharacterized protein n=1 Tax=Ancylomarina euxinus TaxID=2283627 RepID=A0A425XZP4_9BACT|nr:hypothetical protein DWB61_11640 [Ancylomarina euxinus]
MEQLSNKGDPQVALNDLIDIIYKNLRQRSPKKGFSSFYIHSVIYIFKFVKKTRLVLSHHKSTFNELI